MARARLRRLTAAVFLLLAPTALARADDTPPPTLVADQLVVQPDQSLVADGAVEVRYKGQVLKASRITYDPNGEQLTIVGPMTLTDGRGTIVLADQGQLSKDLSEGLLTGARMVLSDKLQLASAGLRRSGGRYTELSQVRASSCQVCPSNPRPLWELRARRVLHDQQERQIYYEGAQFRVAGVPIFWSPILRMPDPTLSRATGFLLPSMRATSALGFGVKIPYFIAMGQSRDLTVTPYVSTRGGKTLGLRYREAMAAGTLTMTGAVTRDPIRPGSTRGYFFANGSFALPADFAGGLQVQTASDRGYLLDYGITDTDRLASGIWATRTRRDGYVDARLFRYHSLRAGDDNLVQPSLVGDLSVVRRFTPQAIGGEGQLSFDLHGIGRRSNVNWDANGDGVTDGRDVARASIGLSWRRQTVLGNGLVLGGGLGVVADFYSIRQDAAYPGTVTRLTPTASVDLGWPLVRPATTPGGATYTLEPVAQLVWSRESHNAVPNEDSAQVEFDEGNLYAFSRFPGSDLYEAGLRANVGLTWGRHAVGGTDLRVTAGRVLRSEDLHQFSTGSRLSGTRSDWLVAAHLSTAFGLSATNRLLFDDNFHLNRDELRLAYGRGATAVAATYVWLKPDTAASRPLGTSELTLAAAFQPRTGWTLNGTGHYDFIADRATKAGLGVSWQNECAVVDISLSRRFTSSTSVRPSTELGLEVHLAGIGSGDGGASGASYRQTCSR